MLRLFIVGCPRSGTTLLQSLLASHPALISAPESHAFNLLRERRLYPAPRSLDNYQAFHAHLAAQHPQVSLPDPGLGDEAFVEAFIRGMDQLAHSQGKQGWLEKTPDHLHCIDAITDAIPDARFIHVLRDPRSTIASLLETAWSEPGSWGGNRDLAWAADKWNTAMAASGHRADNPHHLLIGYEALCTRPSEVMSDICRHTGLPPWNLDTAPSAATDALILPGERWKANNRAPIAFRALDKFRRLFKPPERLVVSCLVEPRAATLYARRGANERSRPWHSAWCRALPSRVIHRLALATTRRARRRFLEMLRENSPSG